MKRRLFHLLAALSLLLCAATAVFWVRGYWRSDGVILAERHGNYLRIVSHPGEIDLSAAGWTDAEIGEWPVYENGVSWEVWRPNELDAAVSEFWGVNIGKPGRFGFNFAFDHYPNGFDATLALPAWALALLTAIMPLVWMNRTIKHRRISKRGLCAECGYDLRATPERCPECGTVPPASGVSSAS